MTGLTSVAALAEYSETRAALVARIMREVKRRDIQVICGEGSAQLNVHADGCWQSWFSTAEEADDAIAKLLELSPLERDVLRQALGRWWEHGASGNRCMRCDGDMVLMEEWREASGGEIATYPHVSKTRPRVAKGRCSSCQLIALCIEWATTRG